MTRPPLEKPVTIAVPEAPPQYLEGIYLRAGHAGGAVVAPPHPLYGGSMHNAVVCEIAYACQGVGLSSLRFNWRGVGASTGEATGDPEAARADYAAALAQLAETHPGPLAACGYSFGAAAAVAAAGGEARVRRLLLVAPPPALLDRGALAAFPGAVWIAAGGRDAFAPPEELRELAAGLRHARLEWIPEADHFFGAGLERIGRGARQWLAEG